MSKQFIWWPPRASKEQWEEFFSYFTRDDKIPSAMQQFFKEFIANVQENIKSDDPLYDEDTIASIQAKARLLDEVIERNRQFREEYEADMAAKAQSQT